jgi:amino acid transporter
MVARMVAARTRGRSGPGLGTFAGVFTPSVLTILGLILFSRMGYVVGAAGLARVLVIVALANVISVLTSASLSAIATNMRVKGGGDYYLISRSLGVEFGGALGLVLFTAQAVSVAFYCIGFGEAVAAVLGWESTVSVRGISGAAVVLLFGFAWLGADWATRLQYVVMSALVVGLLSFFVGGIGDFEVGQLRENWSRGSPGAPSFWVLFALFFPAVTGFTQGVSMSGDLADPGRSLPRGTFAAVGVSLLVYLGAAIVFAGAESNAELAADNAAMSRVALYPQLVIVGVVAATLSSALASFLGAPRILQAVAADGVFPLLRPFARVAGAHGNPRRGVLFTLAIATGCVAVADVNQIAPVVTMFFLISYGLLNYATALEARAASPSFRPRFRFFHYRASLAAALGCLGLMLLIDPLASAVAIAILFALYQYVERLSRPARWADSKRDQQFHIVRTNLLRMAEEPVHPRSWRPHLLVFSDQPARRGALVRFAAWIEGGAGLTTVVRVLRGEGIQSVAACREAEAEIAEELAHEELAAFPLVIAAADFEQAAQTLVQAYGLGPVRANTILLNWLEHKEDDISEEIDSRAERIYIRHLRGASRLGVNAIVLDAPEDDVRALEAIAPSARRIDVWFSEDSTGRLMLLLAYMMTRSEEWEEATIRLLVRRRGRKESTVQSRLAELLDEARIEADVEVIADRDPRAKLLECSRDAALVLMPLRHRRFRTVDPFGHPVNEALEALGVVALVSAAEDIQLDAEPEQEIEETPTEEPEEAAASDAT